MFTAPFFKNTRLTPRMYNDSYASNPSSMFRDMRDTSPKTMVSDSLTRSRSRAIRGRALVRAEHGSR